ncbi:MAG: helix-turn-helix transcriptional regulator [Aquimonas sp.]|nr:helix-turn-helix transcriptional regulator [Aquimonas sp.]
MNCSFARAADVIGDKWALLIIRDAFYGVSRFAQFKRRLGVAPTVLTDRLETLCASGVLERYQPCVDVDRHAYRLTDAGRALFPIVVAFMQWGDEWISGPGNEPVRLSEKCSGRPIAAIQVTNEQGQPLASTEVTFEAGNGADAETRAAFERAST